MVDWAGLDKNCRELRMRGDHPSRAEGESRARAPSHPLPARVHIIIGDTVCKKED